MKSARNLASTLSSAPRERLGPTRLRHFRGSKQWQTLPFLVLLGACGGGNAEAKSPATEADGSETASQPPSCGGADQCEEQCANGDAAACEWAGRIYETGEGAPQDYVKAAKLYDKACVQGRDQACAHLAMMYDIGLAVEEDPGRANELYKKACDSGNSWACKRGEQLDK